MRAAFRIRAVIQLVDSQHLKRGQLLTQEILFTFCRNSEGRAMIVLNSLGLKIQLTLLGCVGCRVMDFFFGESSGFPSGSAFSFEESFSESSDLFNFSWYSSTTLSTNANSVPSYSCIVCMMEVAGNND